MTIDESAARRPTRYRCRCSTSDSRVRSFARATLSRSAGRATRARPQRSSSAPTSSSRRSSIRIAISERRSEATASASNGSSRRFSKRTRCFPIRICARSRIEAADPRSRQRQLVDVCVSGFRRRLPERPSPAKPRRLTKLERLRQRMPFKIDHAAIAERRAQARRNLSERPARRSRPGVCTEAEASLRIAISFDPARAEFKEALGSAAYPVRGGAGDAAARLAERADERWRTSRSADAARRRAALPPARSRAQ